MYDALISEFGNDLVESLTITRPKAGKFVTYELGSPQLVRWIDFETVTVNEQGNIIRRSQKQAKSFEEMLTDQISLEMVLIPGGSFLMGSPQEEEESGRQRWVTVKPFMMSRYPITVAQWRAIFPSSKEISSDLLPLYSGEPQVGVTWFDAVGFCERLMQKTGSRYRLPTEKEWEYACRAGTRTPFYFGETITPALATFDGRFKYKRSPLGHCHTEPSSVGRYPANAFGLHYVHGNVWEWCDNSDVHQSSSRNTVGPFDDINEFFRPVRGGSWWSAPRFCRSAHRDSADPDSPSGEIGFRVVC